MKKKMKKKYVVGVVICLGLVPALGAASGPYEQVPENGGLAIYQDGTAFGIDGNIGAIDFDLDGDWDILMTGDGNPGLFLFENTGSAFKNVTQLSKLSAFDFNSNSIGVGDVDGDMYPDIFLGNDEALFLFMNQGDGTFEEASGLRLPGDFGFSSSVSIADFDKDGDLDAYVTRYVDKVDWPFHLPGGDILLVNDGDGFFNIAPPEWGIAGGGCGLASAWTDIDLDGDLDVIVANDFGLFVERSVVYRNDGPSEDGGWLFTEAAIEFGMDRIVYGMGIGVFDGNRDGLLDYYFTSIGRDVYLESNGSGGVFDATEIAGLGGTWSHSGYRTKWAPIPLDMNGDGWNDLYVRAGHIPAYWFIQNPEEQSDLIYLFGEGGIATWSPEIAPLSTEIGRGGITGDFDGDGIADMILGATDGGLVRHFRGTEQSPGAWLQFDETVSAGGSPGVRTVLDCGEFDKVDELTIGGWFGSSRPTGELFIGVPADCPQPWLFDVHWPSGARSSVQAENGQHVTAVEPEWWRWVDEDVDSELQVNLSLAGLESSELTGKLFGENRPFSPPDDEGWSRLLIEGELSGHRLSVHRGDGGFLFASNVPKVIEGPAFRFVPQRVVAGKKASLYLSDIVWPEIETIVVSGGVLEEAVSLDNGYHQLKIVVDESATALSVSSGSGPEAIVSDYAVYPAFDPELTQVKLDNLYFSLENQFLNKGVRITIEPYDVNRSRLLPDHVLFEVFVDGVLLDTFAPAVPGGPAVLDLAASDAVPGTWLEVKYNGQNIAPAAQVIAYESDEELINYISAAESQFGAAFETCRGDGMDRVAVVLKPRDNLGHLLPLEKMSGLLTIVGEDVKSVSTLGNVGKMLEGEVRCGDVPGQTSLELATFDGSLLGISFPMQVREPEPLPNPVWSKSSLYAQDLGSGIFKINFRPREEWNNLIGSGLSPQVVVNGGEGCFALEYCGVGKYCQTITPPEGAHEFVVWIDDVPFSDSIPLAGEDPDGVWTVADTEECALLTSKGEGGEADVVDENDVGESEDAVVSGDDTGSDIDDTFELHTPDGMDGLTADGDDTLDSDSIDAGEKTDGEVQGDGNEGTSGGRATDGLSDDSNNPKMDGDGSSGKQLADGKGGQKDGLGRAGAVTIPPENTEEEVVVQDETGETSLELTDGNGNSGCRASAQGGAAGTVLFGLLLLAISLLPRRSALNHQRSRQPRCLRQRQQ